VLKLFPKPICAVVSAEVMVAFFLMRTVGKGKSPGFPVPGKERIAKFKRPADFFFDPIFSRGLGKDKLQGCGKRGHCFGTWVETCACHLFAP